MDIEFKKLYQPYRFRTFETKNRIVMPPMAIYIPGSEGFVKERLIDYYRARAKGGVGFIIVNATYVNPNGSSHPNMTSIMDDKFIPGLKNLADTIHSYDVPVGIQLYHAGRQRYALIAGGETMSPSGISDPVRKDPARAPSIEEIHNLVEDYGQAARRAKEAGFDSIEIHCAHGYLLSGFLSPYQNKRTDEYGGDIQGRTRIVREILSRCRKLGGEDLLIGVRINGSDYVNEGNTLEDAKIIAKILVDAGAEYIHQSAGMAPSAQYSFLPGAISRGHNVHLAEGLKDAVGDTPVIACGAIETAVYAEEVLEKTKIDLVALGRPLFADPDLPNKSREGRFKEIRPCLRCSKGAAVWPEDMRCVGNPAVGKEKLFEEKLRPTGPSKKIVVIGAGPAGMEAARICRIRGHNVTLIEKQNLIGGKIQITMNQPHKENHGKWLNYYHDEMERLGVVVKLGKEVSIEEIEALKPDAVIVATGSTPLIPKGIYGTEIDGVITTDDVLLRRTPIGEKVAIIGGSSMGVEMAEFLFEHGDHDIVVIEQMPKILSDISHDAELALLDTFVDKKFRALESTKVKGIEKKDGKLRIKVLRYNQEYDLTGFDTVVIAVGVKPLNEFALKLKENRKNVFLVGDCEGPGDYRKAIHDAAAIAIEL